MDCLFKWMIIPRLLRAGDFADADALDGLVHYLGNH